MKYYMRQITRRQPVNRYGRLGFVPYIEYVKTNDITPFNMNKRCRFYESETAKKYLYHLEQNTVYSQEEKR